MVSYDVIESFDFLNQTALRSQVKVFTSEYIKNSLQISLQPRPTIGLSMGGGTGGNASPQKISRGGQGGRFLGKKTSSLNQYRTMLACIGYS